MRRCSSLCLILIALTSTTATWAQEHATDPVDAARAWREAHAARILHDYASLLAIPNVASDAENIRRNAALIRDLFARRGAAMELLTLDGAPPIVYGRLEAPGATRTLGIYVHYDGQPAEPSRWTNDPWTPTLYTGSLDEGGSPIPFPDSGEAVDPEWRIYARAAGDDKAPIPALLAALDALGNAGIGRTSNLVFFFEGEEEAGSPHLGQYLDRYADRLHGIDAWLIFDGPVHQSRRPQLVFGVRGVTGIQITVYGASRQLHSGHYGNWAPNPAMMLARLLASMKDDEGNVTIDGFYDTVVPVGKAEAAALASVPDPDESLRRELGLVRTEGENTPLKQRLLLPSLNIRGLESANVGDAARNVIPATATASIDIRLVKGNEPDEMIDLVETHIRKQGYHIVREDPVMETRLAHERIAKVSRGHGYVAARTDMNHPIVAALSSAAERAAGEPVILVPSLGGSLPLYLFTERFDVPLAIVPIANHDNNQHGDDENLRLANLWYGIDLAAAILTME